MPYAHGTCIAKITCIGERERERERELVRERERERERERHKERGKRPNLDIARRRGSGQRALLQEPPAPRG